LRHLDARTYPVYLLAALLPGSQVYDRDLVLVAIGSDSLTQMI